MTNFLLCINTLNIILIISFWSPYDTKKSTFSFIKLLHNVIFLLGLDKSELQIIISAPAGCHN